MLRYFLSLLAAFALTGGLSETAAARPLNDVITAGTLRVAVYENYYPFSYKEEGEARGIDVAVARQLADALGVKLHLMFMAPGESLDGDLRLSLWRGDLAGSPLADVMMHVPHDGELAARNDLVHLAAPYHEEQLVLACRRGEAGDAPGRDAIAGKTVAAEFNTAGDFIMLAAAGGSYRQHVHHYPSFDAAMDGFLRKDTAAVIGTRSAIESSLHRRGAEREAVALMPPPDGTLVRDRWPVGIAVKSSSRDLAAAIGEALTKLRDDRQMETIFSAYGVKYTPAY